MVARVVVSVVARVMTRVVARVARVAGVARQGEVVMVNGTPVRVRWCNHQKNCMALYMYIPKFNKA